MIPERRPMDPDDLERMGWWPKEQDPDVAYDDWRAEQDDDDASK